jgi:hypothetical protein
VAAAGAASSFLPQAANNDATATASNSFFIFFLEFPETSSRVG